MLNLQKIELRFFTLLPLLSSLPPLYLLFIFFFFPLTARQYGVCVCVWDLVHFCFLFCRSDLLQFWTPGYRMFPLVGTQLCIMSRRFRGLFYTFCFKDNRCVGVFPPNATGRILRKLLGRRCNEDFYDRLRKTSRWVR